MAHVQNATRRYREAVEQRRRRVTHDGAAATPLLEPEAARADHILRLLPSGPGGVDVQVRAAVDASQPALADLAPDEGRVGRRGEDHWERFDARVHAVTFADPR